jgi:hypothetical protein
VTTCRCPGTGGRHGGGTRAGGGTAADSEYLALRAVAALALALAGGLLLRPLSLGLIVVLPVLTLVAVGWQAPRWYIARLATKRLEAIDGQIPSALMAIAKLAARWQWPAAGAGVRSGRDAPPLGDELARTLRELRLRDTETVFTAPRSASAVRPRHRGDGDPDPALGRRNLAEILTNVTNTVRSARSCMPRVLTTRQRVTGNPWR